MTEICQTLLMVPVAYGQGRIERGRMRVCILPPAIFKNVFDVGLYNFSIISNLFDNNKPYALNTHNRKCANKMHHNYLAKHSELRFKICLKINPKALKWPLQHENFPKIFRKSMPPDPLRAFLVSQAASNLFCRKKYA